MVLRGILPKVQHNMLSQQMKSTPSIEIETDNVHSPTDQLHPIDTPSIAVVANYNNQDNNLYADPSLVATTLHTLSRNHPLRGPMVSIEASF